MTRQKKLDPIEVASAATNKGNAHKRACRIYRQHWADIQETSEQNLFIAAHWRPAVKKLRDAFRSEFRHKAWAELTIQWLGNGWAVNYVTMHVSAYMRYEARWEGMTITREFRPKCIADMHIEAWKLGSALAGWAEPSRELPACVLKVAK
jgi:hypothetical protein